MDRAVQVIRTRLQDSQKLCVNGVIEAELAAGLAHARIAGRAAGALVQVGRVKRCSNVLRSSDSGRYCSMRPGPMSPSGMTSIRVRSMAFAMRPFDQLAGFRPR